MCLHGYQFYRRDETAVYVWLAAEYDESVIGQILWQPPFAPPRDNDIPQVTHKIYKYIIII